MPILCSILALFLFCHSYAEDARVTLDVSFDSVEKSTTLLKDALYTVTEDSHAQQRLKIPFKQDIEQGLKEAFQIHVSGDEKGLQSFLEELEKEAKDLKKNNKFVKKMRKYFKFLKEEVQDMIEEYSDDSEEEEEENCCRQSMDYDYEFLVDHPRSIRPYLSVARDYPIGLIQPYYDLELSDKHRKIINTVIKSLGDEPLYKLLLRKREIEKLGDKIHHIHPFRFLGHIFSTPRLRSAMYSIRKSSFKWNKFIAGIKETTTREMRAGRIDDYIIGFAHHVDRDPETIRMYVYQFNLDKLVEYLM